MSPLKIFITTILISFVPWFLFHTYSNLNLLWLLPAPNAHDRSNQFLFSLLYFGFWAFIGTIFAGNRAAENENKPNNN